MKPFFTSYQQTRSIYGDDQSEKYLLLRKIYPSIQFGRDVDIEQYVKLRQNQKTGDQWKKHYNSLASKYTEEERKELIHVLRKYEHAFDQVFAKIVERLFTRVTRILQNKIDRIIDIFKGQLSNGPSGEESAEDLIHSIEKSISLLSNNRFRALETVNLLSYYTDKYDYHKARFSEICGLLKGYLDGTLFVRNTDYEFDIKEEERKYKKVKKETKSELPVLHFHFSETDIEKMTIDEEFSNEYDRSFAYMKKYLTFVNDFEFANKLYFYSQTNKSDHFRIFDIIRRGIMNNFQKERVFDDIFKIICKGRYVYNISKEQQIEKLIYSLNHEMSENRKKHHAAEQTTNRETESAEKPLLREVMESEDNTSPPAERKKKETVTIREKESTLVKPEKADTRTERVVAEKSEEPVKTAEKTVKPVKTGAKSEEGLSIDEMIGHLTDNNEERRILRTEYKDRLPKYIVKYFNINQPKILENESEMAKMRSCIQYIMQYYNTLLKDMANLKHYRDSIEKFGLSFNNVYSIILECFNDLKSDYLTGNLSSPSLGEPFKGVVRFFRRIFNR